MAKRAHLHSGRKPRSNRLRRRPFRLEPLEARTLLSTFTVTTTGDNGSNNQPLPGSLRDAIIRSNETPGANTIDFNIEGSGVHTIFPLTALPAILVPVDVDGASQPRYSGTPLIELDGSLISTGLDPFLGALTVYAGGTTIEGLAIGNFPCHAILVGYSGGNTIKNNVLGVDPTGAVQKPNAFDGIAVRGASDNAITGNYVADNQGAGVRLVSEAEDVVPRGDALTGPGTTGPINNSPGINDYTTTLGFNAKGAYSTLQLVGSPFSASIDPYEFPEEVGNSNPINATISLGSFSATLQGSHPDALTGAASTFSGAGTVTLVSDGILVERSDGGLVTTTTRTTTYHLVVPYALRGILTGGTTTGTYEISGVFSSDWVARSVSVEDNSTTPPSATDSGFIGPENSDFSPVAGVVLNWTSSTSSGVSDRNWIVGNQILGNGGAGVVLLSSSDDVIQGNTIIHNGGDGLDLLSSTDTFRPSSRNQIQGNFIGVDAAGALGLGNAGGGVILQGGATDNTISNNVISGNVRNGVALIGDPYSNQPADGNTLYGNVIGLNPAGSAALPNAVGVLIAGSSNNTLTGNVISGNTTAGVEVTIFNPYEGPTRPAVGNALYGNMIGTDPAGARAFPNGIGILLEGATYTIVGGLGTGQGNLISGNTGAGIEVDNHSLVPAAYLSSAAWILGNAIGVAAGGVAALPNGVGVSLVESSDNLVRGNTIAGNLSDGLELVSLTDPLRPTARNWIQGNFIGTTAAGAAGLGNGSSGVLLQGNAADNTLYGNVVAGNAGAGVAILSDLYDDEARPAGGNVLTGNVIGLNPAGSAALPNAVGVLIAGSSNNTLTGNVISGNTTAGVEVTIFNPYEGPTRPAVGNALYGNMIGTGPLGVVAFPNGTGVLLEGATYTLIGGLAPGQGNLISGNAGAGVAVDNSLFVPAAYLSSAAWIQGNAIGIAAGGVAALPNGLGVLLDESSFNLVQGNTIAGNRGDGVVLQSLADPLRPSSQNWVQSNLIGTTAAGAAGLGNGGRGVAILGAAVDNSIYSNVISGNATGLEMSSHESSGVFLAAGRNTASGNLIGVTPSGRAAIANGVGARIVDSSDNYLVGNAISGNLGDGLALMGQGDPARASARNHVEGNYIGTNVSGDAAIPNGGSGVVISGASYNVVGRAPDGSHSFGNIISGNAIDGVQIDGSSAAPAVGNFVLGNLVGTDFRGAGALGNGWSGVHVINGWYNVIGGPEAVARNVISANGYGVTIDQQAGQYATGNVLDGNLIGTDAGGFDRLGNAHFGVLVNNALGNFIGRPGPGWVPGTLVPSTPSNVISGNGEAGVGLTGTASLNAVQGNYIGVSVLGTAYDDAQNGLNLNNPIGVSVGSDASHNTIGGTSAGAGNLITQSGANRNDQSPANGAFVGVEVGSPTAVGNAIQGNVIGVDALNRVGSNMVGVRLIDGRGTLVGDAAQAPAGSALFATGGNLISGNSLAGVEISGRLAAGNLIYNNFIGTDVAGSGRPGLADPPLPNPPRMPTQQNGVLILQGTGNKVGAIGAGNLISGNLIGVDVASQAAADGGTSGNLIQGNTIGTDLSGLRANPNFELGVFITASTGNVVDSNLISANGLAGVQIFGGAAQRAGVGQPTAAGLGTVVTGNRIGVDADGQVAFAVFNGTRRIDSAANHPLITLPDGIPVNYGFQQHGVVIIGASDNAVGLPGRGNVLSGNIYTGVYISRRDNKNTVYATPVNNVVQANDIALDGLYGVFRYDAPNGNPVSEPPSANANTFAGTPIPIADFVTGISETSPPGLPVQSILLTGGAGPGGSRPTTTAPAAGRAGVPPRRMIPRRAAPIGAQARAASTAGTGTSRGPRVPQLFEPGSGARKTAFTAPGPR